MTVAQPVLLANDEPFPMQWVADYLRGDGGELWVPASVPIKEGEGSADADLLNSGPDWLIVLSYQFSVGFWTEERVIDQPVFQARCVGRQRDFISAKSLAWRVDRLLMRIGGVGAPSVMMGPLSVSSVSRTGGGPTLLLKDSAQRSHFTASYVVPVPSGM